MVHITVFPYLSPRLIRVDSPDVEITVQDLLDECRAWEDSDFGMLFPKLIDAAGKEELGGGVVVGITATLQNAQVEFQERTANIVESTVTTAHSGGTFLYDTAGDFINNGVSVGDTIINFTDKSISTVLEIVSATEIYCEPLDDGSDNQFEVGDSYKIFPEVLCNVSGGNLVAVDENGASIDAVVPSFGTFVVRTSSSSATLADLDAIQYSSYGGGVSVDVINGESGTAYPIGNQEYPVDNLSDAIDIANAKGFKTLYIRESMTIDSGTTLSDFTLIGRSETITTLTIHSNAICDGITIMKANVAGTLDGGTTIRNCNVGTINYVNGYIHNSGLYGTIYLDGNEEAVIANCYTIDQDQEPIIDMGGSGQDLSLPNYSGIITIQNLTSGTEEIGIGLNAGKVTIDSTVTAGTIIVSGVGILTDNSSGTAIVNTDGLMSKDTIASSVWDVNLANHLDAGSAGLTLATQQFAGAVHINTGSANSGTSFPVGTAKYPVNNLSDALSIATANSITTLSLDSHLTIGVGENISGYSITSTTHRTITLTSGCFTFYTSFSNIDIEGEFGGYVIAESCSISANGVSEFYGIMDRCTFNGNIEISNSASNNAIFLDCYSGNIATPPTIDLNGDGAKLSMRGLTGAVLFTNKTGSTQKAFIDLYSARVGFSSSVTAGEFTVRGIGYVYLDDSSGATFDTQGLISKTTVSEAVWDEPLTGSTHNIDTSAGRRLRQLSTHTVHEGTAQGAGVNGNQIILDTGASAIDGAYDPAVITISDGTGAGQSRLILQYEGSTRVATVDRDWKVQPSTDSEFVIVADPGREHINEGLAQAGSTNTITLNALASSVDNEYVGQVVFIRSGLGQDQAQRVLSYNGTTKVATMCKNWATQPDSTSAYVMLPTAALSHAYIADATWDAATVDHTTAGTTGKALTDAGASGNPWSTPISGNTTSGTFGEMLGKKTLTLAKWLGLK